MLSLFGALEISARHPVLANLSAKFSAKAEKAKVCLTECLPSAVEDIRLCPPDGGRLPVSRKVLSLAA